MNETLVFYIISLSYDNKSQLIMYLVVLDSKIISYLSFDSD